MTDLLKSIQHCVPHACGQETMSINEATRIRDLVRNHCAEIFMEELTWMNATEILRIRKIIDNIE